MWRCAGIGSRLAPLLGLGLVLLAGAACGPSDQEAERARPTEPVIVVTVGTPAIAVEATEQSVVRTEQQGGDGVTQSPMILVTTVGSPERDRAARNQPPIEQTAPEIQ